MNRPFSFCHAMARVLQVKLWRHIIGCLTSYQCNKACGHTAVQTESLMYQLYHKTKKGQMQSLFKQANKRTKKFHSQVMPDQQLIDVNVSDRRVG